MSLPAFLLDGCLAGKCKEARYNEILPITSYFGIRVSTPTTQPSYVGFLGSIRLRWNSESVSFASACQTPSRARHNKGHSERIGVHLLLLSSSVALLFHRYVCHCTGNDNNFLAGLHVIHPAAFTSRATLVGMTKTTRIVRGECGKGCPILFSTHPIYLIQAATMLTNLLWETDYKLLRSAPGDTCKLPAC